jgi:hypothetical protein
MDAHFSVAMGEKQHAFHGSRRAPKDRKETVVGPLSVEIITPMRQLRVFLEANEHNIECDLVFTASSIPHHEPPNEMFDDGHLIMQNSRFTQLGFWEGFFSVDGVRTEVKRAYGTRDKSWGVRPVGESQGGAPGLLNNDPGVYWVWNPINWGDFCTQMGTFEDRDGKPTQLSADRVPLFDSPDSIPASDEGVVTMCNVEHELEWNKGTRLAGGGHFKMQDPDGTVFEYSVQPLQKFYMLGVGYNHFEWGHAFWKGELATGREDWDFADINPLDYQYLHTHQVVKATSTCGKEGVGVLESIVIGRHDRSGFKELFDGAE